MWMIYTFVIGEKKYRKIISFPSDKVLVMYFSKNSVSKGISGFSGILKLMQFENYFKKMKIYKTC